MATASNRTKAGGVFRMIEAVSAATHISHESEGLPAEKRALDNGSVGWDRTNDRPINSRMLYR